MNNIALRTTGMVVFDCDDPNLEAFVLSKCGGTPYKIRTPRRGIHLGFRPAGVALSNRVRVLGLALDVRTNGGLAMIPASILADGRYAWLGTLRPLSELPPANVAWIPPAERQIVVPDYRGPASFRQARNYIDRFEEAISGNGGHTACFIAARKIVRWVHEHGGAEAWNLLLYFNQKKCHPPFDEKALMHKLSDAMK